MLRYLAIILMRLFFKKITISGKLYTGRSALWAANHSNGVVDPTVLLAIGDVSLRPLAKAPLWNNLVMRFFLTLTKAIPVVRQQDITEMPKSSKLDSNWQKQVNDAAFQEVDRALKHGDRILVFPEGLSHDDPFLHPFKTGIARMAHSVMSQNSDVAFHVTLQPVILDYSEKNEFRSELYVEYCEPIVVANAKTEVSQIMDSLTASFNQHFATFKTWDEKRNWEFLFKMVYVRRPSSLQEFRDFVEKNRVNIEQDVVLFGKIQTMRCMLQVFNISPQNHCWLKYALPNSGFGWVGLFFSRIFVSVFMTGPLLLLHTLVWGIPEKICDILSSRKNNHRDVYATMKIAYGMGIFPLWASFVSGVLATYSMDVFPQIHPVLLWHFFLILIPVLLLFGIFVSENLNFCEGYFRFGLLKLTFPRGLEEMMQEWKKVSAAVMEKINQ